MQKRYSYKFLWQFHFLNNIDVRYIQNKSLYEEYLIYEKLPTAFQSLNIYQTKFAYNFPNRVIENRQMSDMLASIKQV